MSVCVRVCFFSAYSDDLVFSKFDDCYQIVFSALCSSDLIAVSAVRRFINSSGCAKMSVT